MVVYGGAGDWRCHVMASMENEAKEIEMEVAHDGNYSNGGQEKRKVGVGSQWRKNEKSRLFCYTRQKIWQRNNGSWWQKWHVMAIAAMEAEE